MKTKYVIYGLCILAAVLPACKNKKPPTAAELRAERFQQVEDKIDRLERENTGQPIENQPAYFGFDSLKKTDFLQLSATHKFFLYFSFQTCSPCIDETVRNIEEVFPDYKEDDGIIFLSPDYPTRFRNNCYGKKLLAIDKPSLGIPLEAENVPFLFTLTPDLKIQNLHVVNKSNFKKTLAYLKERKQAALKR
jgi:hypothetical protein